MRYTNWSCTFFVTAESERAPSPKEDKQRNSLKLKRRRKRKRLDSDDSGENREGSGDKDREDRKQKRKEKMLLLKKKIKRIASSSDEGEGEGDKSCEELGPSEKDKGSKEDLTVGRNADRDKEMRDKLAEKMSVKQERQLDDAIESVVRKAREQNKKEVEEVREVN